MQKTLKTRFLN